MSNTFNEQTVTRFQEEFVFLSLGRAEENKTNTTCFQKPKTGSEVICDHKRALLLRKEACICCLK